MADTIRLKAPTVEQTVVVNIQGEEQLKSFANTLDKVSKGRNLQKYWKDQQSLINDTIIAYRNFNRVANQDNASELLKLTNALQAMGHTDISTLSSELRNITPSIQQAEKLAGTLVDAFSINSFKEAFASFDILRAYGVDMEKLFEHFKLNASIDELHTELKRTYDIIAESEAQINTLQNKLDDAESGRGIAALREECEDLRQEVNRVREEAEQTFSNFLSFHNVDDDSYKAQRLFDEIREGSITAQQAIAEFKRKYEYLLEDDVSFDSTQLQDFSQKLDNVLQKAIDISNRMEEISANGVKVSGNDFGLDTDALANTLRGITNINASDDIFNVYESLAKILTIIKEIGQIDNYNIADLSSVFRNLTKLNDLKINKASLTNLADCLERICKTTNTTTLSSLSTVDLNKFNELHISKASLKNLAEYLPQIAAINTDQLIALTQIDFSNLNNLQTDKTSLKNLQEFVENLKINIQENDADMTTSGVNNSQEITLMQYLANEVNKVTTAVDLKTRAFQEEEQIVEGTVQREISNLQALDGQLSIIVDTLQTIKSLADSLKLNITIDDNTTSNVTGQNNNTSGTATPPVSGKAKRKLIATKKSNNKSSLTYQDEQTGRQITEEWRRNKNGQWTSTTKETTRYTQLENEAITYANKLADAESKLAEETRKTKPSTEIIKALNELVNVYQSRLHELHEQAQIYHQEQGIGTEYTYSQFLNDISRKTDEYTANLAVKNAKQINHENEAQQNQYKQIYTDKLQLIQNYAKAQAELDKLLGKEIEKGSSGKLSAEIQEQQKAVDKLKEEARQALDEIWKLRDENNISKTLSQDATDLYNSIINNDTKSATILQGLKSDYIYKGQEKDFENELKSILSGVSIDNMLFKNVSVDQSGKTTITLLETIGNKAREIKYELNDANDALDMLNNGSSISDLLDEASHSENKWRKMTQEDISLVETNQFTMDFIDQINAFEQLIKVEDKYQKMRAKAEAGKLSDSQLAEFTLLEQARDRWNKSIEKTIQLTKEEKEILYGTKISSIFDDYNKKYLEQQQLSSDTYRAYMDEYMIPDTDPRYTNIQAALQKTETLMKNLSLGKVDGFDSIFKNAQLEVNKLNNNLKTGTISVGQYSQSIKEITENLNNTISVVDLFDTQKAKSSMESWVTKNFPTAEVGEFDQETKSLTYTIKDNGRIVKQMALVYDEATGQIKNMSVATVNITDKFDQFKQSIGQSSNSIFSYVRNAIDITSMMMYLRQGFTMVKEIDQSLTEMRKVSDESYQSLKRYQDLSFDIAGNIGTTANQIQASTADYMRLGYELSVSKDLAKDANIYANVGDMDIDTATEHMISSIQAWKSEFRNEVEASGAILDRYNEIGNNFAITSADIGSAMERSAAALKAGGNTLNESLGLITAGNVIQQDADTTANALKVMSLRIRGSKTELEEMGEETDGLASSTSKLREEIKALSGVDIMLDDSTYKSTARIIQEIGAIMPQLSDVSQAALLEKLAGKTRASVVAGLLENYKIIGEVIESAENAEGSALRENERHIDSITGKLSQATNEVQEILYNLFSTDIVKGVLSFGTTALDVIGDILEGLGSIGTAIAAITGYSKINKFLDKIEGKTTGESISGGRDKELSLCK